MSKMTKRFFEFISSKTKRQQRQQSKEYKTEKSWLNLQFHDFNQTLVKNPKDLEDEMEEPEGPIDEQILDRIQGSMIGLALGDALGAHVEFRPHQYMLVNPVTDLHGGGTWGLHKGQFTDDTSMALCLAISLITQKNFNLYDQLVRYKWWYRKGYMSSTGECFDIGAATSQSIEEFEHRQNKFSKKHKIPDQEIDYLSDEKLLNQFNTYCSEAEVAGNGALMRLAPVPLFFYRHPAHAVEYSGRGGQITHGDTKAYDACRYYGALIVATLHGENKDDILDKRFYEIHKEWFGDKPLCNEILTIAEGSFKRKGGYDEGIRGKGYIVNALEAALWAFWDDGNSFKTGALKAVNLGDDTDTTAAIYGQLAGAYYGYKNLPRRWIKHLYAKKFILNLSEWITYEGSLWKPLESISQFTPNSPSQTSTPKTSPKSVLQTDTSHSTNNPYRKEFVCGTLVNTGNQSVPSIPSTVNDETFDYENIDSQFNYHSEPISMNTQSILKNATSNKQRTTIKKPEHYETTPSDNIYQSKATVGTSQSESSMEVLFPSSFSFIEDQNLSTVNDENLNVAYETSVHTIDHKSHRKGRNSKSSIIDSVFHRTSTRHSSLSPNLLRDGHSKSKHKLSNIFHNGIGLHSPFTTVKFSMNRMKKSRESSVDSMEFPVQNDDTIITAEPEETHTPCMSTIWKLYSSPDLDKCSEWSCEDVCNWIRSLGEVYEDYVNSFRRNNINGHRLLNFVNNTALKDFGIYTSCHRHIILHGIQQLKNRCGMSSPSDMVVIDFYSEFDGDFVPPLHLADTTYPNNVSCVLKPNEDKNHEKLYNQIVEWLGPLPSHIDIEKIEFVLNRDLYRMFLQQIRRTESRQTQPEFQPRLDSETNAIERQRVLDRLSTLTKQVHHNRSVSMVRVWHGCDQSRLPPLLSTGFAALSRLDSGWFGTAMYFTSSAEYATKYTNANGCLIMCYAMLLNPFPVITDDAPPNVNCTNFRFYGRGNYANYQCHYIPVAPTDENTLWDFRPPPSGVQDAVYDEFAIFQQADIIPQIVVHLKPGSTISVPADSDEDPNRIFLSKE